MRSSLFRGVLVVAACAVAGCGTPLPQTSAIMPLTTAGTPVLSDDGAIGFASYALGSPGRTANDPASAARALASIDYLAGALYENPHWIGFPAITKVQMVQARAEVRALLGVPADAPSQAVVDGLIGAATALDGGDSKAAEAVLVAPTFSFGPQRTLAILDNLPPVPQADVAAQAANSWITYGCNMQQSC